MARGVAVVTEDAVQSRKAMEYKVDLVGLRQPCPIVRQHQVWHLGIVLFCASQQCCQHDVHLLLKTVAERYLWYLLQALLHEGLELLDTCSI
jgi:hypothetical protein